MADLTALQAVPGGQIGSGIAQVFNPAQTLGILRADQARTDQLAALEAKKKALQAAAEAKKREEEEVTAKFDVAKGLDFDVPIREVVSAAIEEDRRNWANMSNPQRKQAIADKNFFIGSVNEWSANNKAQFDAVDKSLSPQDIINCP